ncbi:MAG: hypothetical protein K6U89_02315 [Chloroflexi bacterium]|nr:hypothetical protein [Chloroflexota bacterium]
MNDAERRAAAARAKADQARAEAEELERLAAEWAREAQGPRPVRGFMKAILAEEYCREQAAIKRAEAEALEEEARAAEAEARGE